MEQEDEGLDSGSPTNCFICDEPIVGAGESLLMPYSRTDLRVKIEQLLGDDVMIIVGQEDQLCARCVALLNHFDQLEADLDSVRSSLKGYLNVKYNLEEGDGANDACEATSAVRVKAEQSTYDSDVFERQPHVAVFKCKYCGYENRDRETLTNHVKSHTRRRVIYKCSMCDKKFASRIGIENHILYVHRSLCTLPTGGAEVSPMAPLYRTFRCGICSATYPTKEELIEHFEVHRDDAVVNAAAEEQPEVDVGNNSNDATYILDVAQNSHEEYDAVQLMLKKLHGEDISDQHPTESVYEKSDETIHIQITGNELSSSALLEHLKVESQFDNDDVELEKVNDVGAYDALATSDDIEPDDNFRKIYPKPTDGPVSNGKIYVCSKCGLRTTMVAQMKRHIKGHIALKKKLHTCPVCHKVLTTRSNLKRHISNHDSEPVNCGQCEERLTDRLHLKQHMERVHPQVYACSVCSDTFPTQLLRKTHELGHRDVTHFRCPDDTCRAIFLTDIQLRNHQSAQHGLDTPPAGNMYKCNVCHKILTTLHNLRRHMLSHDRCSGAVACNICGAELTDKLHLRQHLEETHPETYKCGFCTRLFNSKKNCKLHELTHPERLFHKCPACEKEFPTLNRLKKHQALAHRDPRCRHCGKEVQNMRKLIEHEKRHEKYKDKFSCGVCGKTFGTPSGLKYHASVHSGQYPVRCDVCDKGFHSNTVLGEHRATHTKEIRFTCERCGRNFTSSSTYRLHRLWHDNPFPYTCNVCQRKFKHTSVLAVHKRRAHTGARPYKCPYCPLAFSVSSSLNKHVILHTRQFPHKCAACDKGFTTRTKLARHLARAHDDRTMLDEKPKPCEYKMVLRPEEMEGEGEGEVEEVVRQEDENTLHDPHIINFVTLETVTMPDHAIYAIFEPET